MSLDGKRDASVMRMLAGVMSSFGFRILRSSMNIRSLGRREWNYALGMPSQSQSCTVAVVDATQTRSVTGVPTSC